MDDDIDIEEHDVLDNPRIKSMFPDLSRVKIEVPDDDEIEAQNSEETPEDCPQIQLVYQYDYNSVTETDHTGNYMSEYDNADTHLSEHGNAGNHLSEYDNADTHLSDHDNAGNHLSDYDNADKHLSEYENTEDNHDDSDLQYEGIDNGQPIEGYSVTDDSQSYVDNEYCQIDSPTEYIPNKIILGSKPSFKPPYNYDILYEEALNSPAVVYLENWGERLDTSPCYCKLCKTLFPTINALDAHKMVSHSYLVAVNNNTARKSTASAYIIPPTRSVVKKAATSGPGRLCNHCDNVFPDDTTLIKHLYELLPLNNFTADNQGSVATHKSKISVKIPVPDAVLSQKRLDDKNIIKKIGGASKIKFDGAVENKYVKSEPTCVATTKPNVASSKITADTSKKIANVDNRQTFFKCTLCHEILYSKNSAQTHRIVQHPTYKKLHIYQKLYKSVIKQKVRAKGKIDPTFIPKSILLQCGKCKIHYLSPYSALQHSIVCNKVCSSENCTICHRNIIYKDRDNHYLQHEYSNDSIKVYTVNRSIYERVLCQCPTCGVCFEELPFWTHVASCTAVDSVHCRICNIKILKSRFRTHDIKHRIKKYTKNDFIVIQYYNQNTPGAKYDITELPQETDIDDVGNSDKRVMFYCPYCKCCQNRQTLRCHIDKLCVNWKKGHKRVCGQCGLMFSQKTYLSHIVLHTDNKFKLSDYEFVNIITASKIDPPINLYECKVCKINFIRNAQLIRNHRGCGDKDFHYCSICDKKFNPKAYLIHKQTHGDVEIMPALLLKYDSLCSTWNLMYMCIECDIVCLSYDTAVEHSQKHIVYATDTSVYCNICHLTIHESYYGDHANLHHTNSRLTVDSFKILKYDYKKMFSADWMDFSDLTEQDVNVILSKSVYKHVRNVKMNVTGVSDAVKYYCSSCKLSVDDVQTHLNVNCKDNEKYRCRYCKTKMDDMSDLVAHELRHENTRNEFKIVTFNDHKDRKLNAKLKKYSSKAEKLSRKRENKKTEKDKRFKAYCCGKCKVCFTLKQNMRIHRCLSDDSKKHFCKLCNQYFTYKFRTNHEIAHDKFPSLSKKTLSIIYFNESHKKSEASDLLDICGPRSSKIFKIVKSTDEEDTKLKLKLKKQTTLSEKRTENDKKYRVYCCTNCKVCVTLKQNTNMHKCTVKKYYCKHCNRHFSYNFRANHERAHLNFPNLCKKTLTVTYFGNDTAREDTPDDISVDKNNDNISVLYKCDCNIHYSSLKTIKKHTKICKTTNVVKEKCTKCGLFFSTKDFSGHMRNHNKEFVIKNVVITDWYQCSRCEILFLTENEVSQHYDRCDPRLGVKCVKCEYKYLRNCINSHRCCENSTHLYISNVTSINQDLKELTVFSCTRCDVNYWSLRSYEKHVNSNHSLKRQKVYCKICRLYFTKISHTHHSDVHKDCKDYKINVMNPITNQCRVLRGKNVSIGRAGEGIHNTRGRNIMSESDGDKSMNITESKKRKITCSNHETHDNGSEIVLGGKRTKKSDECVPTDDTAKEREENSTLITRERDGSGSSNCTTEAMNKIMKGGLYNRYKNTLYKCPKCPLHYLQLESLRSHVFRHEKRTAVEHPECTECNLKFSAKILPKHKRFQHEISKYNLEDLDIRRVAIDRNGIIKGIENESNVRENILNNSNTEVTIDVVADIFNDSNIEIKNAIDGISQDSVMASVNNKTVDSESIEASTIDLNKKTAAIDDLKKEIRLFKCGNCNVCFITRDECLQHVYKHDTIDSKYYISCKICNFQFMISSLKLHMENHHESEFKLEDLMIEEYTVLGDDLDTKIDVYYAIDRVQSRLISTTTDVGKDDL